MYYILFLNYYNWKEKGNINGIADTQKNVQQIIWKNGTKIVANENSFSSYSCTRTRMFGWIILLAPECQSSFIFGSLGLLFQTPKTCLFILGFSQHKLEHRELCTQFKSIHIVTRPFKAYICTYTRVSSLVLNTFPSLLVHPKCIWLLHRPPHLCWWIVSSAILGIIFTLKKRKKKIRKILLPVYLLYYINTSDTLQHTHTHTQQR